MREYFLAIKRLKFSVWNSNDTALAIKLWGNPQVMQYLSVNGSFSNEQVKLRLQQEITNNTKFGVQYWPIFTLDNIFIGCCGLKPYATTNHAYEAGMQILPDFWGIGYATEAMLAVIDYARSLGIKELFAGHHPQNKVSKKVLIKVGFIYSRDEYYPPTKLDHPLYSLIL